MDAVPKRGLIGLFEQEYGFFASLRMTGTGISRGALCTPLRSGTASDALSFGLQQFEQQGVHVLRGLSGLYQIIPEVVDPRDDQPVLEFVQVQIAFLSFHSNRLLSAPL